MLVLKSGCRWWCPPAREFDWEALFCKIFSNRIGASILGRWKSISGSARGSISALDRRKEVVLSWPARLEQFSDARLWARIDLVNTILINSWRFWSCLSYQIWLNRNSMERRDNKYYCIAIHRGSEDAQSLKRVRFVSILASELISSFFVYLG